MKHTSKFLSVLLALALFLSCARTSPQLSEKPVVPSVDLTSKKIRNAIVSIESENASGTGFFVAPDKIATSIHVVAHAGPIFVKSPDTEKSWTIEGVAAYDTKNRLVVLKITGEGTPLPLGNSDALEIGDSISILGYPNRKFKTTNSSIQSIRKNNKWLRVKTATSKKTNGSPVFNNKGQVIGIIVPYGRSAVPSNALAVLLNASMLTEPLVEWQQRKHVRAAACYSLAKEKLKAKDYAGAIVDFDKSIELNPKYVRAYYERGRTQARLGDNARAIASCTQAIKIDPQDADAYYGRGTVKALLGNYTEAIVDLDKAIELDAEHANAYRNRGLVKLQLSKSEDALGNAEEVQRLCKAAIADCEKAIQIDPEDADAYNGRGAAKSALDDFEGAIFDFNRGIEIDPEHADIHNNRGWAQFRFGESENKRGNAKKARSLYQAAIADCNKAIQIDPEYATAYRNRGAAKDGLGDFAGASGNTKEARRLYEVATVDYNKAIQINPKHADAYNNRAIVKCKLADIESEYGDTEIAQKLYHEGITDHDKSIQLNNPDDIDPKTSDPAFTKTEDSTVHIMKWTGTSNSFSTGSGFFVDEDKIVTNIHVVASPGPCFAKRSDDGTISAIEGVVAFDVQNDLVVLKLAGEGMPLPLGDSDMVKSGETVIAVGYPNKKHKVTQGSIHSTRNSDKWIRMNIATAGGSSGSPVLNSSGQVVGVDVSRVNIDDESYALAIPSNTLKTLLAPSASTVPLIEWQNRDPIRAYNYQTHGKNKYEADEYQTAIADFDKAIQLNPWNIHTYYKRGIAKAALGKHKAAIADFDKAIEINTEAIYLYLARRNSKRALSDYKGAIADLNKAIQLYPEHPYLHNDRGKVRFRLGASEFSGGNAEKAQALYEAAIEDYTQAIKLDPEHAEAHSNLGTVKSALSAMRGR